MADDWRWGSDTSTRANLVAKDRKSPNILIPVGILYRPKIMVASPNLQSSSNYAEAFSLSWFKVNRKSSILKSNFN